MQGSGGWGSKDKKKDHKKKKITSYQAYSLLGYYVENKDNFKLNVNFILQMYPNVAKAR